MIAPRIDPRVLDELLRQERERRQKEELDALLERKRREGINRFYGLREKQ